MFKIKEWQQGIQYTVNININVSKIIATSPWGQKPYHLSMLIAAEILVAGIIHQGKINLCILVKPIGSKRQGWEFHENVSLFLTAGCQNVLVAIIPTVTPVGHGLRLCSEISLNSFTSGKLAALCWLHQQRFLMEHLAITICRHAMHVFITLM